MNKKIIISLLFVGLLFAQVPLKAQTPELPGAGFTPDNFFYFLDEWGEGIQEFFTFTDEGKSQLQVLLIGERVAEIKVMLNRKVLNPRAIDFAFIRIESHKNKTSVALERLKVRGVDIASLAATIANKIVAWEEILNTSIKVSRDKLGEIANTEKEELKQRMEDQNFIQAIEDALRGLAEEINIEVGRPLEEFTIISSDVDVSDDTYSSTHIAEAITVVDLTALRDRILAVTVNWEIVDVALDDDSLDTTFEKAYPAITIDGIELTPETSVTIGVTINNPRQGMTSINYDIDITLKTESERLASFLENQLDEAEEILDDFSDEIEGQMDVESAARKAIQEAEEEKQGIVDEAAEEDIAIPAGIFDVFDDFLSQAKSALAADNYQSARQFAKQTKEALEKVEDIIDELRELKEETKERLEEDLIYGENISFKTIATGFHSGYKENKIYTIKQEQEWNSLRSKLRVSLPDINFTQYMVIAAFQGSRRTGGYGIRITEIIENQDKVTVYITETSPGPDDIVIQVLTDPFHIIKFKRTEKNILFNVQTIEDFQGLQQQAPIRIEDLQVPQPQIQIEIEVK